MASLAFKNTMLLHPFLLYIEMAVKDPTTLDKDNEAITDVKNLICPACTNMHLLLSAWTIGPLTLIICNY